jgi:hypothetical protein
MTVLTASPFTIAPGSLIEAYVIAQNGEGQGVQSATSTGAVIAQTIPSAMATPTNGATT